MSRWNVLHGLVLAGSILATGCLARGAEDDDLGSRQVPDSAESPAAPAEPVGDPSAQTTRPVLSRGHAPDARSGCNTCGNPVPWTPPPGSLRAPFEDEPAEPDSVPPPP